MGVTLSSFDILKMTFPLHGKYERHVCVYIQTLSLTHKQIAPSSI